MINARLFVQGMIALAAASLVLIVVIAQNEAIVATMLLLGLDARIAMLYMCPILATIIAVVVLVLLGRLATQRGGNALITRAAEG